MLKDQIKTILDKECRACGQKAGVHSDDRANQILKAIKDKLKERIESKRTGGGLRLDNYKEGYKSGYDKAIDDLITILEEELGK